MDSVPPGLELSQADRAALQRVLSSGSSEQRLVVRARIVLLSAQGQVDGAVAAQVGVNRHTVRLWRQRFGEQGMAGLGDASGRGRKPYLDAKIKQAIVTGAVQPAAHRTRWSCRSMARAQKVSPSTVQRLWRANDIQPHLTRTFKGTSEELLKRALMRVV